MKVYSLTNIGKQQAKTPTAQMTPAWKIIYFLDRRGGSATDDIIYNFCFTPQQRGDAITAINLLKNSKPPLIEQVG
jgi:hypothetical protein